MNSTGYEYGQISRCFQPFHSSVLRGNFHNFYGGIFLRKPDDFYYFSVAIKDKKSTQNGLISTQFYSIPSPQWLNYWMIFHTHGSHSGCCAPRHHIHFRKQMEKHDCGRLSPFAAFFFVSPFVGNSRINKCRGGVIICIR
jgi:hypothetical protein